jgi:hypothetical protein
MAAASVTPEPMRDAGVVAIRALGRWGGRGRQRPRQRAPASLAIRKMG